MELEELKNLRKQIREVLLNSDEIKNAESLDKKKSFQELKKDCYVNLVDLKNEFESDKENLNKESTMKKINELISSLNKIKTSLSGQL